MKVLCKSLWLMAATIWFAGCTSTPAPKSVAADPTILRVGVCPNAPPMVFKQGGQIVGVERDLAEGLAKDMGRRLVFVEVPWEKLIDALNENRIDIIMSSMSITPARRYRLAFTQSYLRVGQIALARNAERYRFQLNLRSQVKNGIGVKPVTTADFLVQQEFPQLKRKYYRNGEEAADALVKNDIDLFISDAPLVWYLAGMYESKGLAVTPLLLSQEDLGWGVRREDTALIAAANNYLKKIQASGDLNRTFSKWMPGFH